MPPPGTNKVHSFLLNDFHNWPKHFFFIESDVTTSRIANKCEKNTLLYVDFRATATRFVNILMSFAKLPIAKCQLLTDIGHSPLDLQEQTKKEFETNGADLKLIETNLKLMRVPSFDLHPRKIVRAHTRVHFSSLGRSQTCESRIISFKFVFINFESALFVSFGFL